MILIILYYTMLQNSVMQRSSSLPLLWCVVSYLSPQVFRLIFSCSHYLPQFSMSETPQSSSLILIFLSSSLALIFLSSAFILIFLSSSLILISSRSYQLMTVNTDAVYAPPHFLLQQIHCTGFAIISCLLATLEYFNEKCSKIQDPKIQKKMKLLQKNEEIKP